jgi:hypothetical protein
MKIRTMCNSCFTRFLLESKKEHAHLLDIIDPDMRFISPCPKCGGGYIIIQHVEGFMAQEDVSVFTVITLEDIYRYMVTKEPLAKLVQKSAVVASAVLKSSAPTEVVLREVGDDLYLDSLIIGKVKIHLSSGSSGARIIKMEELADVEPI